jgi:hypothetical protein
LWGQHRDELRTVFTDVTSKRTLAELTALFDEVGLPFAPVRRPSDLFDGASASRRQVLRTSDTTQTVWYACVKKEQLPDARAASHSKRAAVLSAAPHRRGRCGWTAGSTSVTSRLVSAFPFLCEDIHHGRSAYPHRSCRYAAQLRGCHLQQGRLRGR